ncbi:MAG: FG-GAP-like repeat-containing protein [Verrucomicrobiota bacterium]
MLSEAVVAQNHILENGSGVALGDVDGDGKCDIYFCRLEGPNVLYRNLGDWKFEDVTASAGVACDGQWSTGAVFADVDGDGDLDLFVNGIGRGTRLFLNDSHGDFVEMAGSGLLSVGGSHSMALADVDDDGDLDLYVANYRTTSFKGAAESSKVRLRNVNGQLTVTPENAGQFLLARTAAGQALLEIGEPDVLYLNDGHGHFTPESWTGGRFRDEQGRVLREPPRDWGLSAMFRDINGDGAPDLYVCNDFFSPDRIWINDGRGGFQALPRLALRKTSFASMAVDFGDLNRDGHDDFIVVDMLGRSRRERMFQRSNFELAPVPWWGWPPDREGMEGRPQTLRNTLFLGRGDGTFAEAALAFGVQASGWSWGVAFLDVDLDGYEDLLISNGHGHDMTDSDALQALANRERAGGAGARMDLSLFPRLATANVAFRNVGGVGFEEVGREWGFGEEGVSNGMGVGDLDGDGDLDVVLNNLNGVASVLRNEGAGRRVGVRLKGEGGNTGGIGARVVVRGGPVEQSQEMICGGRYLSGSEAMRVFAGSEGKVSLEVRWRSGRVSHVEGVEGNGVYEVEEKGAAMEEKGKREEVVGIFEDQSGKLGHEHVEMEYDDFGRQPLLGRRLSTLGPGVCWMDLNGDGKEDLVVGGGRGGELAVYGGDGAGNFVKVGMGAKGLGEEEGGVVGWNGEAGRSTLLVGEGNYVGAKGGVESVGRWEMFFGEMKREKGLKGDSGSVGPLAVGDVDGDGELEVFVGGRVMGGKYPEAGASRIYRRRGAEWEEDEELSRAVSGAGMVSGAVWSDLDGDGYPELVLACEWGPVRVYGNRGGKLEEQTRRWGLEGEVGQWNSVSAGDVDGDGRMDLVVGNFGVNTVNAEWMKEGVWLYWGDVDGNGTWEVIEGWQEGGVVKPRRDWKTMGRAVSGVMERFGSYREYGEAGMEQVFGAGLSGLKKRRLGVLESKVYLNRGGRFEGKALPMEAQMSPVFGVCIGDYDGDGVEDVYVSQNFYGTDVETGRYDGGRGLWMRGDGKGWLEAVSGERSGVKVYGEGRGAALGDYDGDGRVDLVVGQNGGATRLYRNRGGKAGLRVRLVGMGSNGNGIGAVMRLRCGEWKGPAREVHGGGGYWSQDSAVSVLGVRDGERELQVTWPGGRRTLTPVPPKAREITVQADGRIVTP